MRMILGALLAAALLVPAWAVDLDHVCKSDSVPFVSQAACRALELQDVVDTMISYQAERFDRRRVSYLESLDTAAGEWLWEALVEDAEAIGLSEEDLLFARNLALGKKLLDMDAYAVTVEELEALALEEDARAAYALTVSLIDTGDAEAIWQRLAFALTSSKYAEAQLLIDAYVHALAYLWAS